MWNGYGRVDRRQPPFMASILDGYSAMHAYGQGVAQSALGNIAQAERAQNAFRKAKAAIPEDAILLSNNVQDMLDVGDAMLDGELQYRKRNYEQAFEDLCLAVKRDDALNYTEPWAWMHPPRHALGVSLEEQGRFDEAKDVFRADPGFRQDVQRCSQHPNSVWALKGIVECIERTGKTDELISVRQQLEFATARADISIKTACFCRSG